MDEGLLYQMTSTELIELLNKTRLDFVNHPGSSFEAKEKKEEMDLILRIIVAKRNESQK